ncbi:MAG TPA: hypothetical protein VGI48_13695 [Caldimonas sp.]|jgi:hypothetical protein
MRKGFALLAALLCASSAQASLQPRDLDPSLPGFEGVYDSTRNITWLRDIAVTGLQTWDYQTSWAASLSIGPYDDWRLSAPVEIGSIFLEWQTATKIEFDVIDARLPGSDVGFGSPLFNGARFGDYWTNVANDLGAVDKFLGDIPDEGYGDKGQLLYAWAVHDGDIGVAVSAVPEPESWMIVLAGLAILVSRHRQPTARKTGVPALLPS